MAGRRSGTKTPLLRLKPIYTIKSQLGQWRKLRRLQVATGGQRGITSYFAHTTCTRTARNAQTADDGSAAAAMAASSPAATTAWQTATAATASQLRRLANGRIAKRKDMRHRANDDDNPDGATGEFPALTAIDTTCADPDAAAAASAALPDVATAASQAATVATADPSKRQLTVAKSFQRATRRRTDDPGNTASPPSDAPPLTTATPSNHPDPLPPPDPSPARWSEAATTTTEPTPRHDAAAQ